MCALILCVCLCFTSDLGTDVDSVESFLFFRVRHSPTAVAFASVASARARASAKVGETAVGDSVVPSAHGPTPIQHSSYAFWYAIAVVNISLALNSAWCV